jgi:hypothetical protein
MTSLSGFQILPNTKFRKVHLGNFSSFFTGGFANANQRSIAGEL